MTDELPPETKKERVLRLLITMGSTGLTAHHMECGKGLRLSGRVLELRDDGHDIETEHRKDKVCIYRLIRECQDVAAYRAARELEKSFGEPLLAASTC